MKNAFLYIQNERHNIALRSPSRSKNPIDNNSVLNNNNQTILKINNFGGIGK
jgi:hypothetical protein